MAPDRELARLRRQARRLRRQVRRMRRRLGRRTFPDIPEGLSRPDPCVGRVVFTGLGGDGLAGYGKVEEMDWYAPFAYALARAGVECLFVTERDAALEAASAPGAVVVHVFNEVRGEHLRLRGFDRAVPEALIFNRAALGPWLARKDRTRTLMTRAGVPMPRPPEALAPEALVLSHARRASGAPATVGPARGPLEPGLFHAEFIDTRRPFRGVFYHNMVRLDCVGREVAGVFVRIRPESDGAPDARMWTTPLDPEAIAHFRDVLLVPRMAEIRALARRAGDALGPGFYSHDVVTHRDGGPLLLVESGFKLQDLARAQRPIAAWLPEGYVPFVPNVARDTAAAFLRECRRHGFLTQAADIARREAGGAR